MTESWVYLTCDKNKCDSLDFRLLQLELPTDGVLILAVCKQCNRARRTFEVPDEQ